MALTYTVAGSNYCDCNAVLVPTDTFTLSTWGRVTTYAAWQDFITQYIGGDNGRMLWGVQAASGKQYMQIGTAAPSIVFSNTVVGLNTWFHIAVTEEASTIRFYLNGVADGGGPIINSVLQTFNTLLAGTIQGLNGSIFDTRIYTRLLLPEQIKILYESQGADNITTDLVARYLQNEKTSGTAAAGANSVIDVSPSANHATPVNSPAYLEAPLRMGNAHSFMIKIVAPPPVQVIEPIVCAKSYPQVIVAGKDLYALNYVKEIINIDELKTFQSKLIQNNYNMVLNNTNDAFSVDNPVSLFAGSDWRYGPIQIIDDDGEEIWKGVIEDIQRDHKTKLATMSTKNSLVKVMNTKIAYTSADWETTANAARNILDQENYTDYNVASFTSSAATLDSNSCYVKCFFNLEDDITLQQCLEKLAEFGAAYSYAHAGDLYYKHWKPFTGGVKVNLTIADLASPPIVSSSINDLVNDYSIGYEGDKDIPATDLANGNIGSVSRSKFGTHSVREMDGGANSQIVYKDLTSAVYIGETLIRRVHQDLDKSYVKPLTTMAFSLPLKHQEWVDLETFYRFSFSEEGWTDKLFEVFRFQRNFDQDRIDMLGMGRQE